MKNIRWVGKLCLVVAIALELGAIFINLREGHSAFYLFDLAYKFSIDNNFFLVYWGAILGIIFVSADFINKVENKGGDTETVIKDSVKEKRTDDMFTDWQADGENYYASFVYGLPLFSIFVIAFLYATGSLRLTVGLLLAFGSLVIWVLLIKVLEWLYKNHYLD